MFSQAKCCRVGRGLGPRAPVSRVITTPCPRGAGGWEAGVSASEPRLPPTWCGRGPHASLGCARVSHQPSGHRGFQQCSRGASSLESSTVLTRCPSRERPARSRGGPHPEGGSLQQGGRAGGRGSSRLGSDNLLGACGGSGPARLTGGSVTGGEGKHLGARPSPCRRPLPWAHSPESLPLSQGPEGGGFCKQFLNKTV